MRPWTLSRGFDFAIKNGKLNELAVLAGDEGFEPPQTESESGVLPLHKSPKCLAPKRKYYYTDLLQNVKTKFENFAKIRKEIEVGRL